MKNTWIKIKKWALSATAQKWWWVGGTVVATFLIISAILRSLTPQTPPITLTPPLMQNLDKSTSRVLSITYTGEPPALPDTVLVGTVVSNPEVAEQLLSAIISTHELKKSKFSDNIWIGPTHSLSYSQTNRNYTLIRNEPMNGGVGINADTATQVAMDFVKKLLPTQIYAPLEDRVVYISADLDGTPTTPEEAGVLFIPFAPTINNQPIHPSNVNRSQFEVMVTYSNEIQRVSWFPYFFKISSVQPGTPISIDQALENIKKGSVSIISAQNTDFEMFSLDILSRVDLTQVKLEYRFDPNQNLVIPFFHFYGIGIDRSNTPITLELLTPALNTTKP